MRADAPWVRFWVAGSWLRREWVPLMCGALFLAFLVWLGWTVGDVARGRAARIKTPEQSALIAEHCQGMGGVEARECHRKIREGRFP